MFCIVGMLIIRFIAWNRPKIAEYEVYWNLSFPLRGMGNRFTYCTCTYYTNLGVADRGEPVAVRYTSLK